jgi:phosphoribosylaminoimidazole-succinocarboxamide synthase
MMGGDMGTEDKEGVPSVHKKHKLLRRGKVKEVFEISDDVLEFRFTDDISVFDKRIPNPIPHKGETLAGTSAHWFKMCTRLGVNHHFLELSAPNCMRVRRVEVSPTMNSTEHKDVLIPLEFIVRYYVAGTLWDRLRNGKQRTRDIGLPESHIAAYGDKLPSPFFEMTTKLEHVDRLLTEKEAMEIGGLTKENLRQIQDIILKVDQTMAREIEPRGLIHVDGKKEFAFDNKGEIMLVDTFGTADEDRFWDAGEVARGRFEEFSKEFVRQHYRRTGYHTKLMEARDKGEEEPPIPPLPPHLVEEVSRLYTTVFERLTGELFKHKEGGGH